MVKEEIHSNNPKHMYEMAKNHYESEEYALAKDIFIKVLKGKNLPIEKFVIQMWLGLCYYNLQQYDDTFDYLCKALNGAIEAESGFYILYISDHLASAHHIIGDFNAAEKHYNEGKIYLENYNNNQWKSRYFNFRLMQGRNYVYLNKYDLALEEFFEIEKQLNKKDDDYKNVIAILYYEIGRTYHFSGDQQKASKYLERVNAENLYDVYFVGYHFVMARFYGSIQQHEKSLLHINKLEKGDIPDDMKSEVYNIAGRANYKLKRFETARKYFQKSQKYPASDPIYIESNRKYLELIDSIN